MTYRGIDPETIPGVRLVGLSVQPIGTPALSLISLAGRDGALVERQGRGGKQIDLIFALLVRDPADQLPIIDRLNAWAWGGEGDLALDGDGGKAYRAWMQAATAPESAPGGRVTYTFCAPDGLKYGPEQTAMLSADSAAVVNNPGNAATAWTLSYTVPEAVPDGLSWTNGVQTITLTGEVPAGAQIGIDAGRELITIGGESAMARLTWDSRFFQLAPGANAITGPGVLTYRGAWL